MKIKQKINSRASVLGIFGALLIVSSFSFALFANPQSAAAETVAGRAGKYCKKYKGESPDAKKRQTACTFGYIQGDTYCDALKPNFAKVAKNACKDGANKGKSDPDQDPDNEADPEPEDASDSGAAGGGQKCDTSVLPKNLCDGDNGEGIWGILLLVIGIMTAGVGVLAVGGIVYAAILYTTAGDKAAQVIKAKETIFNVVIGLLLFATMWAFLQFLIPGGVFKE